MANFGQLMNSSNRAVKPVRPPDGSQIALDCDGLCIALLDGTINKVVDSFDLNSLALSHDGTRNYFSEWHDGILKYDMANSTTMTIIVNDFGQYNELSLKPIP